ncbi:MAG: COX15/CtaA family protein [Bacteroidetes bacterium]|nr:COX15/CtaA family protein [Bacteroidota bacterium]
MIESTPTLHSRWRFYYATFGLLLCLILVSWGGVVTSIEAGLAVPDWPTSFGSYDPIATGFSDPDNPDIQWWQVGPILAEHGHRLVGALVGLWIMGFALWTFITDKRQWVRVTAISAVGLVILQGTLGGLRVIWESLDLAVAHAMGAQLFFSTAAVLTLSNSQTWFQHSLEESSKMLRLRNFAIASGIAIYLQILLGALLRHPGAGIDINFIVVHVVGSILALSLILITCGYIREHFRDQSLLNRGAWWMLISVGMQILLGVAALIILLHDSGTSQRSLLQVILSSSHLVIGTIVMGSCACVIVTTMKLKIER